jgi:hypothetical protein
LVFCALAYAVNAIRLGAPYEIDSNGTESWTVDALLIPDGNASNCEPRLNYTEEEMVKKMEYFSRKLDPQLFDDAMTIQAEL